MYVHEDSRRKLIEWANGDFKVCKALIAKENCVVGNHYHRNKDESFLLLSGKAIYVVIGSETWGNVEAPYVWSVPRGNYHRFEFVPGSVLIGVGTEAFDEADEIRGFPVDNDRATS
jgi:hypothetical protein